MIKKVDKKWIDSDMATDEELASEASIREAADISHQNQITANTNSILGLQTSKYDASNPSGFETPTQLNTRDTNNRNRANHTGTQLSSTVSNFASTVLSTLLTGLSVAVSTVVTTSDTLLIAIGKLQAQITGIVARTRATMVSGIAPSSTGNTTYTTVGDKFIWIQSRNTKYKNGVLLSLVTIANRNMSIRVYDTTNAVVLGQLTNISLSGSYSIPFNNPTTDATIEVQMLKVTGGGTNPTLVNATIEFDSN